MIRLIAGCIAVAWVFSGWRNFPRLDHPSALAAGLAVGGTCLISYFLGKTTTKAEAYASARANAEARAAAIASSASTSAAHVQLVIANGDSAAQVSRREFGSLDGASWIGEPVAAVEQDVMVQMLEDGQLEEEEVREHA